MIKEQLGNQNSPLNVKRSIRTTLAAIKLNTAAWLLLIPSLISFIIIVWMPMISGIVLSFFETKGYDAVKFVGLRNFIDVIQDSEFKSTLLNTVSYTVWSLIIGFLFPIFVGILLNEMIHLKAFFKFSVYFPTIVPGIACSLLWSFMFDPGKGGLLNSLLAQLGLPQSSWLQNPKLTIPLIVTTMTWKGFGGTSLIYLASLQGINQELYEASIIDGASVVQRIRYITLPQIANIILLMLIMQIIGVFQVMAEPLTMTDGGPNNASTSLMLQSYFYAFRYFRADKSMALGVITFVMLALLTVIYQLFSKKATLDE
ncbi:MAG TPA: sugar ABC transporter permease [Clostridiaceae bacterium]|nr:sugar ABC transporter permease [Clostridiaceae bacterium]